ncbi:ATP-binding protein [Streptomyces guryensis]|uniref:ATP-binding protein n=1 Tax=Streptomyces guryensis TaxID=2886947 RepID=A0A9Q3Z4B2_9ACTN|nr:ATP-binding protein [Streptomyces guryensis]MCD9872594.1 ATP-binding protein [Streptomyces guryensis]
MTGLPTSQPSATVRAFAQCLTATPRAARLARHLAVNQLDAWGIPHGSDASDTVALIVAELAANAVTHGRVPGRDFELRLSLVTGSVRIEVTDTRAERHPRTPPPSNLLEETGRGLLLVDELADRWEVLDREPPPGKTVRAEVDLREWPAVRRNVRRWASEGR